MNDFINTALIVSGIDEEYQNSVIDGITSSAAEFNMNISCFACFGGVLANKKNDIGEYNIYNLINYDKFDGFILMTNTVNEPESREIILNKVRASGKPTVVFDCDSVPEFYNIKIDNFQAMSELVEHVISVHGAKKINYVSGPLVNPEAKDRYDAFCSVMERHGLEIENGRLFFGEFRAADGVNAVNYFEDSKLPAPDAVICANDAMALAAADELELRGHAVPEDIIVTGFDNTFNARYHFPSITTVNRPLEKAGRYACQIIHDIISGKKVSRTVTFKAEPLLAGSCGCCTDTMKDMHLFQKSTYKLMNKCRSDISLLNRITTGLANTESAEENFKTASDFIREIDCQRFTICLCSDWNNRYKKGLRESVPKKNGPLSYTEIITAPLILENGRASSVDSFESSEMYPFEYTDAGNVSYFLPLHFREHCLGYYIITNSDFPTKSMLCHSIMLNISNSIENIRRLLELNRMITELDKLYVNDQLCNIYNRNGFIRAADEIYNKCLETGEKLLISFIDMDGLKYINDNYGHKEGDFALQRLASIITDCTSHGRICARFGGDEFIILGSGAEENDVEKLENDFSTRLSSLNMAINKPYEIGASIGVVVTEVNDSMTLFSLITKADEIMYEKKKRKKTSRYLRRD